MKPVWPIVSGICATMTGIGLSRFAYAPLLPAIVQAGLLSGGQAGALGAINLGGYLCGAALAPAIGRAITLVWALRLAMLTATACFLLCAIPGSLLWLAPWRALTGFAGGLLMVLAGPAVQAVVPASMRGLAAGLVFAGVGSGIVIGGVLIPAMLPLGLPATWLALAVLAGFLTILSWRLWPNVPAPPAMRLPKLGGEAGLMVLSYVFAAIAQTVHMVWWPDFIARGLHEGPATGALFWMLYGASAACGPALFGRLADRIGAGRGLQAAMALQLTGLALPLISVSTISLLASTILAGGTAIGSTALTLTRARELGGPEGPGLWRISTSGFGLAQTATGFFLAWLYSASGSHTALFWVGATAALAAFLTSRK